MKQYSILLLLVLPYMIFAQGNFSVGIKLLEKGKYQAAAGFFQHFLEETNPSDSAALFYFAKAIELNGEKERAKIIYEELHRRYPNDREIEGNLSKLYEIKNGALTNYGDFSKNDK